MFLLVYSSSSFCSRWADSSVTLQVRHHSSRACLSWFEVVGFPCDLDSPMGPRNINAFPLAQGFSCCKDWSHNSQALHGGAETTSLSLVFCLEGIISLPWSLHLRPGLFMRLGFYIYETSWIIKSTAWSDLITQAPDIFLGPLCHLVLFGL